jgi:excinuclease ABC subunit C
MLMHAVVELDLISEALSLRAGGRVDVGIPQRGEKQSLGFHAMSNAREALGRKLADSQSQARLLQGLQRVFDLSRLPERIEVYDNSHIQGSHAVGAMVVAGPEGLMKGQYRRFNIRTADMAPGDDHAMMREVLTRRFARLVRQSGRSAAPEDRPSGEDPQWPDLVLIDGGEGQLAVARNVLDELALSGLRLAGIAKGPDRDAGNETFYRPSEPSIKLPPRDPLPR